MTSDADTIIDLYRRHGLAWAADRGDRLMEGAWLGRFAALLPAGGSVLDIGCGSGRPIARSLIERGLKVTGIDAAPDLIAACRASFPDQEWQVADMRILDLGRTFDGLIAWDSFFHLDHAAQRAMFRVFRRHASPGAALMFTSGSAHGVAMSEYAGEPLFHASLAPLEYHGLLEAQGFAVEAYVADDADCGHHTVWLARLA